MTIEVVDPTRLRDSLQCLRMYYWQHERHVIPIQPRLPLIYGVGVHATLATHYEGGTAGQALAAFEEIWDREVVPFQGELAEEDSRRNPLHWAEMFMLYRRHYQTEPFRVLGVEQPFFLPVTDDLAFGGIIDLVIEWLGQVMIMDHKTATYLNPGYFATFNPNHQFGTYLIAANEVLRPEKPITTLIVNCLKTTNKDKDPAVIFQRASTQRSPAQLAAEKQELIDWWSNVVRTCRRTRSWPRNDDRCQRWKGGCVYHPLCTDIQADYRRLIPSPAMYKEKVWDPIQTLREKGLQVAV